MNKMSHADLNQIDIESFRERSAGKRIVLLYPWTNYRTLFLKHFLMRGKEGLLYYRVRNDGWGLIDWLQDLTHEFSSVFPNFGKHLREAIASGNATRMGEALAQDLSASNSEPLILFVDEFDRLAVTPDFEQMVRALVRALPDRVQIALSSSMIPSQPWNSMINDGSAIVLGNQQHRSEVFFTVESQPKPQLEVHALGAGKAYLNGREITSWEGILPRTLFFYLVDHPLVTRDQIFEDFWSHMDVKDATDIFHVTKHKVSEVLGRYAGCEAELTAYKQGFYIPSDRLVRHYDVENYEDALCRAFSSIDEHETEMFLQRAIDLYRGHFLEGMKASWVERRRAELRRQYSEALIWLGKIYERRGDDANSFECLSRAVSERPEREDIRRSLILLQVKHGRMESAQQMLDSLVSEVYAPLKIAPPPETVELASELHLRL